MNLSDFAFTLPPGRIAQNPVTPRDSARLFVYDTARQRTTHATVRDLPSFLPHATTIVTNNSRVKRSRLYASIGGSASEVLVLEPISDAVYRCMLRGKNITAGTAIRLFAAEDRQIPIPLQATVTAREEVPGMTVFQVLFEGEGSVADRIQEYGSLPLPPYISGSVSDESRYQTVYAKELGSAAAPTAGLHFTPRLMEELRLAGLSWEEVTLHVGLGTFLPLRHEEVTDNRLHSEMTFIGPGTAQRLTSAISSQAPVLAVGTTTMRTLESHWETTRLVPGWKPTDLFVYPGYTFSTATALMTNFHLPKSSLLLLVSAFLAHRQKGMDSDGAVRLLMNLYEDAIGQEYQFFSFGDAMLIL